MEFSATDFPLLSSAEMGVAMGSFVESRVNFVAGSAMMEQNRAELYVDDQVGRRSLAYWKGGSASGWQGRAALAGGGGEGGMSPA